MAEQGDQEAGVEIDKLEKSSTEDRRMICLARATQAGELAFLERDVRRNGLDVVHLHFFAIWENTCCSLQGILSDIPQSREALERTKKAFEQHRKNLDDIKVMYTTQREYEEVKKALQGFTELPGLTDSQIQELRANQRQWASLLGKPKLNDIDV
jgi:hypothetical protein